MEKKKSNVTKIISILKILNAFTFYIPIGIGGFLILLMSLNIIPPARMLPQDKVFMIFKFLFGILYVLSGVYLFKFKDWARKISIILDIFAICVIIVIIIGPEFIKSLSLIVVNISDNTTLQNFSFSLLIVLHLYFVYYFTRPKVKEQFKTIPVEA